jgi:plasmid stabilization system protein ParE
LNRFVLSRYARRDLEEIRSYIELLPRQPSMKIGRGLQRTLKSIAIDPYLGSLQSEFTRLAGAEVRSRLVLSYRIFYIVGAPVPEIVAILHTARDIASIVASRLQ